MSVRKRKDRKGWEFTIDLDRGADGKRRQRHGSGYRTKAEAVEAEHAARSEKLEGLLPEGDQVTVTEYLAYWLKNRTSLDRSTRVRYEQLGRLHVEPLLGGKKLRQVRPLHLQQVYEAVVKNGRSPTTAKRVHALMHVALGQAVRWQLIARNPAESVEPPKQAKPELHVPSMHETRLLLAQGDKTRFGLVYRVSALTALREGELLAMRWPDVDWEHSIARITRGMRRFKGEGLVFKDTKSHRGRQVALSSTTIELLQEQRRLQLLQMEEEPGYAHNDLVFADPLGRALNPDTVRTVWIRDVATPLGLADVRVHDLRHRQASTMMAMGINAKIVSERLGHHSSSFTMDVYGHFGESLQAEAAEAFDELLRGK